MARMTTPELRPVARLLVDAVVPEEAGPPPAVPGTLRDVVVAARDHRVLPAVARHLATRDDCPPDWRPLLRLARDDQVVRHLGALGELAHLGAALDDAGVPWAVAKGPVAAGALWPALDMREYYDLDLYVERSRFEEAVVSLRAAGCTAVDRNWPLVASERRAELALRAPRGSHVDLHWDIAVPRELRTAFRTDLPGMLRRRRRVDLGGGHRVWTFDAEDTLLLLAFHAAQAGAGRLVWLADVRRAAEADGLDWDVVVARARAARVDVPLALVLDRADRVLGLPAGAEPACAPAHGLLGRVARRRDDREPPPGLPGDAHRGGGIYAAARPGTASTLAALLRGRRATRRTERAVRRGVPGADEKALLLDVPDERAERAYFAFVRSSEP